MSSPHQKLKNCLAKHSKGGNVTSETCNDRRIYQFDLSINGSNNKWSDVQPLVSAVSVKDGLIRSYNIRIGELQSTDKVRNMRKQIEMSKPPCIDRFDTGHSDSVIQPHIRMTDNSCSIDDFTAFIDRLMKRLN